MKAYSCIVLDTILCWIIGCYTIACISLFLTYSAKLPFVGRGSLLPAILLVGAGGLFVFISKIEELDDFLFFFCCCLRSPLALIVDSFILQYTEHHSRPFEGFHKDLQLS